MRHLIITGGLGFIGKNFYKKINKYWDKITIIDKNTYSADINFIKKIIRKDDEILLGDICDKDFLKNAIPEKATIVHFAAESHVDSSFKSSENFTHTNTLGTHLLLNELRFKEVHKIIIISTDEVYGSTKNICNELSTLNPSNPYSASKAASDLISQSFFKSFKMPIVIVRPNNIYGPFQHIEKIIPATISAASGNKELNIHGSGDVFRHYLHVDDLTNALKIIIEKFIPGEIYNINGKSKVKIIDLIKRVAEIKNIDINSFSQFVDDRPFNDYIYRIDGNKIRSLGWNEEKDFNTELETLAINNSFYIGDSN